jgi:preprotein translocase subunit YajC
MYVLQINDAFTQNVHLLSALIAIVLAIYFLVAYKKYTAQIQRQKMLDSFLKD